MAASKTPEHRRKISAALTGKRKTKAHREAIRRGAYRRWARAELEKQSTAAVSGAAHSPQGDKRE